MCILISGAYRWQSAQITEVSYTLLSPLPSHPKYEADHSSYQCCCYRRPHHRCNDNCSLPTASCTTGQGSVHAKPFNHLLSPTCLHGSGREEMCVLSTQ